MVRRALMAVAALLLGCGLGFLSVGPAAAEVLKTEPAMGNLIGGDHRKVGGRSNIERQRVCIPRK